jgi:hypothetical protein
VITASANETILPELAMKKTHKVNIVEFISFGGGV